MRSIASKRFHVLDENGKIHSFATKKEAMKKLLSCDQSYQCHCFWWEGKASKYERSKDSGT
jgi:hypothetical protein